MKKWIIVAVTLTLLLVATLGCGARQESAPSVSYTNDSAQSKAYPTGISVPAAPVPAPSPPPMPASPPMVADIEEGYAGGSSVKPTETDWSAERMIVRTANISIIVDDVRTSMDSITKLAESLDGYVVSSNVWEEGSPSSTIIVTPGYKGEVPAIQDWKRMAGAISIRVPAERFDTAMSALRGIAIEVNSENTSSRDVTQEYVDLTSRLKNLEATEEQLLRLLEKAEKVEDILNIQRELSSVRGDIEQIKGRMQYLERTSETSLIDVQLQQSRLDVAFTADKSRAKIGEDITFFPQIAGGFAPYSYEWDFGDDNTSTDQTPAHSYNSAGDYTVILKVTDDRANSAFKERVEYITVLPGWQAGSIASSAWNGLVVFGQVLADIFICIGVFIPLWIVIGALVWWFVFRRRRRK